MRLSIDDICECTGGVVVTPAAPRAVATGVTWDSREVVPGSLFVALPGDRVDGHDFAGAACDAGAVAVLASRRLDDATIEKLHAASCAAVQVADTAQALADLARRWRASLSGVVVGITGSSGKTTTKNLVRDVLGSAMSVVATKANQNNELGVPRTVLAADAGTRAVVVEMGMRGPGQIAWLASYVKPDIGLVTNVGTSHIELLGSREGIARAKGELLEALPEGGTAIVNAADDFAAQLVERAEGPADGRAGGAVAVLYDGSGHCDPQEGPGASFGGRPAVWAEGISLDGEGRPSFVMHASGFAALGRARADGSQPCRLELRGAHNVSNACAATAVGLVMGMTLAQCCAALAGALPERGRQQVLHTARGVTVVDDSYNANPDSMRAALSTFAAMQVPGRRIAVLGDMGELGDYAGEGHRLVGSFAAETGVDLLVCVGTLARGIAASAREAGMAPSAVVQVPHTSDALDAFASGLAAGDAVLVKASHSMELNRVVEGLMA